MFRLLFFLPCLLLLQCKPRTEAPAAPIAPQTEGTSDTPSEVVSSDPTQSVVRITATRQRWNPGQPWEKQAPRKRRSLGAIVDGPRVITTAEMVADATFIELETTDGLKRANATVVAVDYEANLALLKVNEQEADDFFQELEPLKIAEVPGPGDTLEILQVEDNGNSITTRGPIQSVDVVSNFLPAHFFLTYEVKASMQSAASSFTLPVLFDGALAGLLTSYNSKDQLSDVSSTEILQQFLKDASDGEYEGFPSLGISTASTEDSNFRAYLKLPDEVGGIYISKVRKDGSADKAGIKTGDVITTIDALPIDRLGYFDHEIYGRLFWSHLVRGSKAIGESATLEVLREGEPLTVEVPLERLEISDQLVPSYAFGTPPNYLIKGGLLFQELSQPLLEAFGEEWRSRAPLNLLDAWENPTAYEEDYDRIVFLSGVIATPATVGYESLRNMIVSEVNGTPIRSMSSLVAAFDNPPADGLHSIRFKDEEILIYLDEVTSTAVDGELMQRGISRLHRADH